MVQAPNRYPQWLHPEPRVTLGFGLDFLTNFPSHYVAVGQPKIRMFYRTVEPADYHLRVTSTNWIAGDHEAFAFRFKAKIPGRTNRWTAQPRGTVILLHGYGLAQFAMAPWALQLAQDGWRCVLVDLRGHGKSSGRKIYYGTREIEDLKELLDALNRSGELRAPVSALGESYGAALALRWKAGDARIQNAIAIAPYGSLSNAVLNICADYAAWIPDFLLRAGLRRLPSVLNVAPEALNTTTVLARHPVRALFIAGAKDDVAPVAEERELSTMSPGNEFIVVPGATHEGVTYFMNELTPPIERWLEQ